MLELLLGSSFPSSSMEMVGYRQEANLHKTALFPSEVGMAEEESDLPGSLPCVPTVLQEPAKHPSD